MDHRHRGLRLFVAVIICALAGRHSAHGQNRVDVSLQITDKEFKKRIEDELRGTEAAEQYLLRRMVAVLRENLPMFGWHSTGLNPSSPARFEIEVRSQGPSTWPYSSLDLVIVLRRPSLKTEIHFPGLVEPPECGTPQLCPVRFVRDRHWLEDRLRTEIALWDRLSQIVSHIPIKTRVRYTQIRRQHRSGAAVGLVADTTYVDLRLMPYPIQAAFLVHNQGAQPLIFLACMGAATEHVAGPIVLRLDHGGSQVCPASSRSTLTGPWHEMFLARYWP
jgi:hypothetical protein